MKRKPVGVAATADRGIVVVCDDGSTWRAFDDAAGLRWLELEPIPGSERAELSKP